MSPPKYTTYELKLEGNPDAIAFLKEHLPAHYATIAEANAKRRAICELLGDAVKVQVISVRRIPARTKRRVLKI